MIAPALSRPASGGTDQTLVIALLLNVALILFGWRRHRDLASEVLDPRRRRGARHSSSPRRDPLTGFLNRRSLAEEGAAMFVRAAAPRQGDGADDARPRPLQDDQRHARPCRRRCAAARGRRARSRGAARRSRWPRGSAATNSPAPSCSIPRNPDSGRARSPSGWSSRHGASRSMSTGCTSTSAPRSASPAATSIAPTIDALMRSRRHRDVCGQECRAATATPGSTCRWSASCRRATSSKAALRAAIPRGEIVPYFEQQIDLATGRLHGFEVLARWEHPHARADRARACSSRSPRKPA